MLYKKDCNHNEIADQWRRFGWIVIDTSWSRGKLLDFMAYKLNEQGVYFVEVKHGKKALTDDEKAFIAKHPERSLLLRSAAESMAVLAGLEARF